MLFPLVSSTRICECDALDADALEQAAAFLSGSVRARVLVVKDPRPVPAFDKALAGFLKGHDHLILDRIVPNPLTDDIMSMVNPARDFRPDLVIGFGGGSALDSAKAVRVMMAHDGDLDEYLGPAATRKLEKQGPKLILIPTTTGTGSEVTKFGVYTARSGRKYSLNSPLLQADAALLVSSLVADIPPSLLAATAYDAITHALETLWNRNATPVSDLTASYALRELLTWFPRAWDARQAGKSTGVKELLAAACAAGASFNQTGTAAIHALSFIMSEEWHLPHGPACAFFTEDVFDFNCTDGSTRTKLASVYRSLERETPVVSASLTDQEAVLRLRQELVGLKLRTGLPSRFADLPNAAQPLSEEKIAELFDKVQDDFKMKNNIVPMDAEAVRRIVRSK